MQIHLVDSNVRFEGLNNCEGIPNEFKSFTIEDDTGA
jgi:hypothetical protein